MNSMPGSVRRRYRIGTTSCIYPAGVIYNVSRLKKIAEDIELVFFEYETSRDFLNKGNIEKLAGLKSVNGLSYTVHLPLDTEGREISDVYSDMISRSLPLKPEGYVAHFTGPAKKGSENISKWQSDLQKTLSDIIKKTKVDPEKICVENLNYPIEYLKPVAGSAGVSLCIDIGHLQKAGADSFVETAGRYVDEARIVHLYGINPDGTHGTAAKLSAYTLSCLREKIERSGFDGILTFEVFSEQDLESSLSAFLN